MRRETQTGDTMLTIKVRENSFDGYTWILYRGFVVVASGSHYTREQATRMAESEKRWLESFPIS